MALPSRLVGIVIAVVTAAGVADAQERVLLDGSGVAVDRIELFVAVPDGPGPYPAILFAHGHQSHPRPGGRVFDRLLERPALATVDEGRLRRMRDRGYVAAAVSLPGYGRTTGPADFWGPRSQTVIAFALDHLAGIPQVDDARIALYGVSGGAAAASMVATQSDRIRALILVAGLYDLERAYPTGDLGLDAYIEREAGLTQQAFASRAALRYAHLIQAATLILHGGDDLRGGAVDQAAQLAARLQDHGAYVRVRLFDGIPHSIPIDLQWQMIDPFLSATMQP